MYLVIYTGCASDPLPEDISALDQLKEQILDMSLKTDRFKTRVEQMHAALNTLYAELLAKLDAKTRELKGRHQAALKGVPYVPHDEDADSILKDSLHESKQHEEKFLKKINPTASLKKLYREIAMCCHPDRTPKPSLHALFKQAGAAYRLNDLPKLQEVWTEVQHLKGSLKDREAYKADLTVKLKAQKKIYAALVTDTSGQLLMLFDCKETREVAETRYYEMHAASLARVEHALAILTPA